MSRICPVLHPAAAALGDSTAVFPQPHGLFLSGSPASAQRLTLPRQPVLREDHFPMHSYAWPARPEAPRDRITVGSSIRAPCPAPAASVPGGP